MNAITFIVFGLIGYWIYFSIKKEGIFWIPKMILCIGGFALFIWGGASLIPILWEPFIKSTSALGQLIKTAIFGLTYSMIFSSIAFQTVFKWLDKIDDKIEERIGKKPYE
tara:strand:- start:224 stop:553 length:330 start_codon:yes stop_codon:yes gene_type:complete